MRGGGESGVGEGTCLLLPHPWTRLSPAGGKGLDGPAHAHLAAQTCRRLRLAGAPYPSCAKSARARPGKNVKTQKLRNPGGPGPYEIVAVFARTCLHVGEYVRVHVARLHSRPRKALSPSGLLGAVG